MSSTALAEIVPTMTAVEKARFWAKVDKNGPTMPHMSTPCWEWTGTKSLTVSKDREWRYGRVHIRNHRCMAHILSQWMAGAVVPAGAVVCHHCDNPSCVNPDHLYAGSFADNARDRERRNRSNRPSGKNHWNYKISEDQKLEIYKLRKSGKKLAEIANLYGITFQHVSAVCQRVEKDGSKY